MYDWPAWSLVRFVDADVYGCRCVYVDAGVWRDARVNGCWYV